MPEKIVHPGNPEVSVFGIRLSPGEIQKQGDLLGSPTDRMWLRTISAGMPVPKGPCVYVRPMQNEAK